MKSLPQLSPHLFWEFDLSTFNYQASKKVVIERVVQRGNLLDWREIYRFFGKEEILKTVQESRQLTKKDKNFTKIFLQSSLLHVI
jgi:hypothetical protein